MPEEKKEIARCGNCEWEGEVHPDAVVDGYAKPLILVHHLWERLDPGCEVPAGECPECQCLCYHTDDRSISRRLGQWRDMANAAVDILEQLQEGAHDYLWSEVAEIIEDRQVLTDVVDKFYLNNEGD